MEILTPFAIARGQLNGFAPECRNPPEAALKRTEDDPVVAAPGQPLPFHLLLGNRDGGATLDAQTFNVSGLNLPKAGRLPFEEALRLRLDYALEFETLLGELFGAFLELRLDEKQWKAETKTIHGWAAER